MGLPADVKELAARVRNWGRWGDDDEIGTLNLITDDVVRAAAREIQTGKRFRLGIPLDEDGPQMGAIPGRDNPKREMIMVDTPLTGDPSEFTTSDDKVSMGIQAGTHWDALAHVSYEGTLYNGVPSSVITATGAEKMGIDKIRTHREPGRAARRRAHPRRRPPRWWLSRHRGRSRGGVGLREPRGPGG